MRTRFLLLAPGRDRAASLKVADKIAEVQQRWAKQLRLCWLPFGQAIPAVDLDVGACLPDDTDCVLMKVASFSRDLRLVDDNSPEMWAQVALVHPPSLPSRHYWRIRTRLLFVQRGRGRERSLELVALIAKLQRRWRLGPSSYFIVGRVRRYLVPFHDRAVGGPPPPTRAHGRRSRNDRQMPIAITVIGALEVVAHAWLELARDPTHVRITAFGRDNLRALLAFTVETIEWLRAVPRATASERLKLASLLEGGFSARDLPPDIRRELKQRLQPSMHAPTSTNDAIVLAYIRNGMRNALWRFRDAKSPRLTPDLVRRVRRELPIKQSHRKPADAGRELASLVMHMAARILARRLHIKTATVLEDLLRPILRGDLNGILIDGDTSQYSTPRKGRRTISRAE